MPIVVIAFVGLVVVFIVFRLLHKILGESKLDKVNKFIKMKNYEKAHSILKKFMKSNPNNYTALWYNAKIYYQLNNFEASFHNLKKLIKSPDAFKELNPASVHFFTGEVMMKLNKSALALNEYLLVTQYEPQYAAAYAKVGEIFFNQRNNDKALRFLFNAIKYKPEDYYSHYLMGRVYYYMEIPEKALECLKESLKYNKEFLSVYYYLAKIEHDINNFDFAVQYAEHALQDPNCDKKFDLYYILGSCYQKRNDYKQAVSFYEKVNDEIPIEHPLKKPVYYNLGLCYEQLNQVENLMMVWKKLYYMDATYEDVAVRYRQYSDIQNEEVIKDILEADDEKIQNILLKICHKLNVEKREIRALDPDLFQITANEISQGLSFPVLIYFNRSFDIITIGMMESFLDEIRISNSRKGYYISLSDFETDAITYSTKYPIDIFSRSNLIKLLRSE